MSFIYYLVASLLISYLMAPKPPEYKGASLEDFDVPTADENRSVPVIFGTCRVTGPNVTWYGDLEKKDIKKRSGFKKVKVGEKYYLGLQFVVGYCVDEIQRIDVGDKAIWSGSLANGATYIDQPDIFGGNDSEGGISGVVRVQDGNATQSPNAYLDSKIAGIVPAMRGLCSVVLEHGYVGNSKYLKNWAFLAKRTDVLTDGSPQWYVAKANINGDLNAAHIIRECYTNDDWGMGYSDAVIDDANFKAVADALYSEGFGLSLPWIRSESIDAFTNRIFKIINAVPQLDMSTGLLQIKLIRDDYNAATIPSFDEQNIVEIMEFERRGWGETTNQITLTYTNEHYKESPVTVENLANIYVQGAVVSSSISYTPIRNYDLAVKVAQRELENASAPLSKVKVALDRTAYAMKCGDVFKLSSVRFGLVDVVYRMTDIDPSRITDGVVIVDAVEDAFALPTNTIVKQQNSDWAETDTTPQPVANQIAIEASYAEIKQDFEQGIIDGFGQNYGFAFLYAASPQAIASEYTLLSKSSTSALVPFEKRDIYSFTLMAYIAQDITIGSAQIVVNIVTVNALADIEMGTIARINDEALIVDDIDIVNSQVTLSRGTADTVPGAHTNGDIIWFAGGGIYQGDEGIDRNSATELVVFKALTITPEGILSEGSAPQAQVTLDQRAHRPYPPAYITINGIEFPASESGDLVLSWRHRDRLAQGATLYAQDSASIGPEAGTTYTIRIYDRTVPTLIHTESGISVSTWTYTQAVRLAEFGAVGPHDITVEIESERDGLTSLFMHSIDLTVSDI
jgi:hypothetical protein